MIDNQIPVVKSKAMPRTVQTVLGCVDSETIGTTLTHEHLLIDLTCLFLEPSEASRKALAHQPVTIANLNWIRYNGSNWDNCLLTDENTAISEAMTYKKAGGQTLVDCTSVGLGRDPMALARISRATGLNIVMGCGYYVAQSHPSDMDNKSVSDISNEIIRDLTIGVDQTRIKAGIIGEIGCSWPLHPNEAKVLRAAAHAWQTTGAPMSIHPGRHDASPNEIMEILIAEGADPRHVIMGHIERTIMNRETLKELALTGCFLEYDLFGRDISYYFQAPHIDMPTDAQRLEQITWLIAEGHVDQILLAQDVCMKIHLESYGGFGYGHILEHIVPWMRQKGFAEKDIHSMLVENPRRALAFSRD